jgi:hypothetical protein
MANHDCITGNRLVIFMMEYKLHLLKPERKKWNKEIREGNERYNEICTTQPFKYPR